MPGTASGSRWKDPRPDEFSPPLRAPGLRALDGNHHHLSESARSAAALHDLLPVGGAGVGPFLGECHLSAGPCLLPSELWRQFGGGHYQRRNGPARRLGAGALRFPGRKLSAALVELPFALPPAVAGISLTTLYGPNGWIGRWLEAIGIKVAFTPLGVAVALTFIGLPFVVRTVQPVLQDLEREIEEAAASLGASRWQTFRRVLMPPLLPALLTGFALAFARSVGEYGSVVFISGNMPMK